MRYDYNYFSRIHMNLSIKYIDEVNQTFDTLFKDTLFNTLDDNIASNEDSYYIYFCSNGCPLKNNSFFQSYLFVFVVGVLSICCINITLCLMISNFILNPQNTEDEFKNIRRIQNRYSQISQEI